MATNAIVSIIKKNVMDIKIVCGCDGFNIDKIDSNKICAMTPREIYNYMLELGIGCKTCLVVSYAHPEFGINFITETDLSYKDNPLYWDKFNNVRFNPRWDCGIASHTKVIYRSKKW